MKNAKSVLQIGKLKYPHLTIQHATLAAFSYMYTFISSFITKCILCHGILLKLCIRKQKKNRECAEKKRLGEEKWKLKINDA